ncbi:lytic transglycosylase domain-containing protein [Microbacterium sp. CFBP 8801]|uniref:aggregation-promoting factor C-terminal-like domain-containing protein n=1 Tax=Microbacterium sp. CFBP 8801 TaxID=2774036 RepID=UPI00177ECD1D|nr:lytic transglycosylase domain-containing protein [Microbacterium sp. CFBP 8801]MBD8207170.1 lytic transglycosylase domain-containing protein [Microbacterium sp. CFBP 8801]
MRSDSTPLSNRRARRIASRRSRRRPVLTVGALVVGVLAAATLTGTAPAATASPADLSTATFTLASTTTPTALSVSAGPEAYEARAATATATQTLAAATAVQNDIAASGLDIGQPAVVDTTALEQATDRLEDAAVLPPAFLPEISDSVSALTTTVDQRVAELRGGLDAAIAKKAEEEAAEKARQEAEAAAAAAEKAAAEARESSSSGSGSGGGNTGGGGGAYVPAPSGGGTGDNSVSGAQASARAMLGNYGWGDDQFGCLVSLWNKESGWNYQAYNGGSGAYGIPQALPGSKMSSAGGDWQTHAATQVAWGLGYISGRYGSPCGAWSHSQSVGWY